MIDLISWSGWSFSSGMSFSLASFVFIILKVVGFLVASACAKTFCSSFFGALSGHLGFDETHLCY